MKLKPGDIFCSENSMFLGKAINVVQRFISADSKAQYSHSGLILDESGTTFEALWKNKRQDLFKAYEDKNILVGRHLGMTPAKFMQGWQRIEHHEGKIYAGYRLLIFLLCPPLAKYLKLGLGVCSELTAKHWYRADLIDFWAGVYPDKLADMIHNWRSIEIIYEGVCPGRYTELP